MHKHTAPHHHPRTPMSLKTKLDSEARNPASTSETGARRRGSGPRAPWPRSFYPERSAECSGWRWETFSGYSTRCTPWTSPEVRWSSPSKRKRKGLDDDGYSGSSSSRRRKRAAAVPTSRLRDRPPPLARPPSLRPALDRQKGAARGRGREKGVGEGILPCVEKSLRLIIITLLYGVGKPERCFRQRMAKSTM